MLPRVTLDTNCLLDLEEATDRTAAVREMIARHDAGRIELHIPAIMASERQRHGTYLDTFAQFEARRLRLGVQHLPLLSPMGYYGISFWDQALWVDDTMVALEKQVHEVLHPGIAYEYAEHCRQLGIDPDTEASEKRWRNAKCDVQVAWSHIHHGGDVLVTSDEDFTKKAKLARLLALGAKAIVLTIDAPALSALAA